MLTNCLAVIQNFPGEGILFFWNVVQFFKQRQVAISFDVTLGAWVAIPIPGATKRATLFNDHDVVNASIAQSRAGLKATKATTDQYNIHFIIYGFTFRYFINVRIFKIVREIARHLDILLISVFSKAFIAFNAITFP